jgi:hypothetical protein
MKIFCPKCKAVTTHTTVSTRPMTEDEIRSMMASCRGVGSDYRTVCCEECGKETEYDFAKD